jgi:hypothetical protein
MRCILPLCAVLLAPMSANAQLKVNDLYGKNLAEVNKILGKPVETAGSPVNYARYRNPNFVACIVWFNFSTGIVSKAQFSTLGKTGETPQAVLKKYGLSLGENPKVYHVQKPAISMVNNSPVAGMPWTRIFISYLYAYTAKQDLMEYCKAHNLAPAKTWFWTIQVLALRPPSRMVAGADTGSSAGKGKGKGKKGGKGH